ncbi:23S rRNA (uracil(1939)-C(5))-methyltransferase RlmD [Paludibacter jiangxiensis]|uniref:23S rRNA (Uracil1939-C5)-methyltransferase n=1 Tax=Paludibacter jiangxiensis TaxID=681398 RepID=A0A171AKB1_9BACT|nr:23S rRNA (uracil(1939)-C(5))-methyltransferase RlmD [Paludibacter jiangxiensis]GAT63876.1 23S rRNA (uracil1939-C5)-methyltransferase [Paludibacter jiangxiensis]
MRRTKKPLPILENVTILDVAAEGKAIAKNNDMVIFVPYVAPSDIVDIQLTRKKNSYAEGKAVNFHSYSTERVEPVCEHFGVCGGCKWQHLNYQAQLKYKQQQVTDNLTRIGKIELPDISPILGSKDITHYRNKLEFTFSNKRWMTDEEIKSNAQFEDMNALGFHIPTYFDKVLDIKKCWLQDDIANQIRLAVRSYAIEHHLAFFDLRNQAGFLRNMIIRTSTTGELMLIMVFFKEEKEKRENLLDHLLSLFPNITSLVYIINEKVNDTITDQDVILYHGRDHIFEQMEDLKFKIGAKSFYQTNSKQAYELYKIVRDFAQLSGNELVYDLYTGTGTIANFVSHQAKKVVGIEYVPEAIEDAKVNSELNSVQNTLFYAGDMKDILNNDFINEHGHPDVIITDPPRAGMHTNVVDAIIFAAPKRIVYVSCNPATQARDLSLLDEQYKVTRVQPVDMFPHTHHVENVVLLEKR